ncbi:helix-turn-helix domain-containing protein [Effusibacillus dendaii]|uniref:helix-turn-helix domain-containing protein n=1 Tax=Effusibacillus dendaii TaxID=2743772 RepID=UPI00190DB102|nr:helix-turn-helix domain-containing protein [Effusibacillus dendaii]
MNDVHKAYSFRLYPTKEQEWQIRRTIGCCRFVFNHFLSRRKEAYERDGSTLNQYACMRELPALKTAAPLASGSGRGSCGDGELKRLKPRLATGYS